MHAQPDNYTPAQLRADAVTLRKTADRYEAEDTEASRNAARVARETAASKEASAHLQERMQAGGITEEELEALDEDGVVNAEDAREH